MKLILCTLAIFTLVITALHAQVPATPADSETAAFTSVLPVSWQGYATIALVLIPLLGRGWHAWVTNGGAKGIWNAIVFGTNTPLKLLIVGLCMLGLSSCGTMKKIGAALSTPQAKQVELALVDLGLHVAVGNGVLSPGDMVTIGNGVAVITSGDTTVSKVAKLADIGIDAAVAKNLVKPGDAILIKATTAVVTQALTPVAPLSTPAVATSSGK